MRQYKALFLFGSDVSGKPITLPLDHIVGASALRMLIEAPSTPDPLLAPLFRNRLETRDLIKSMRAAPGCSPESRSQMCCNRATGQCGVADELLQEHGFGAGAMGKQSVPDATPATSCPACSSYNNIGNPLLPSDGPQTTGHITGAHQGNSVFTPECTYVSTPGTSTCTATCHVEGQGAASENGLLYGELLSTFYCHQIGSNNGVQDGWGSGANITCGAAWGYAVAGCVFCTCAVSVTLSVPLPGGTAGITASGTGVFYTWASGLGATCAAH